MRPGRARRSTMTEMTTPPEPPPGGGLRLASSTTMLLIAAGRVAQRQLDAHLAENGLTLRHVGALGHLAHTQGLTYSDLARRARVTPQSMHATMTQLAKRGAITIEARGRAAYPQLTELGHQLLVNAADVAAQLDHTFASPGINPTALRAALEGIVRQNINTEID